MPARTLAFILAIVIAAAGVTVFALQFVVGSFGANPMALAIVSVLALLASFAIRRLG